MAAAFPYSHVACPCTSLTTGAALTTQHRRSSHQTSLDASAGEIITTTFNPHDPRANYSLYPYDHLLYCDECHQIRCPRCWTEEILNWYCPSCLFEVPSSVVKSDGNRCTRNCYNCPSCTAPLSINALDNHSKDHLSPQDAVQPAGPFVLSCPYCDWTSLDVGIELSKPTKITEQLTKLRTATRSASSNGSRLSPPSGDIASPSGVVETNLGPGSSDDSASFQTSDERFAALNNFYKTQLSESAGLSGNSLSDNSPNNLARIMSLYGGLSYTALKKSREKPQPMREALSSLEGLELWHSEDEHAETIEKLHRGGHLSTTSPDQRNAHPYNHNVKFSDELWPTATLLRTRRSKRCRVCRHILTKPEPKIGSTRYKIRLLAQNHIPRLSLRLFSSTAPSTPAPSAAFALTASSLQASKDSEYERLRPLLPVQFLLTLTNPLFDPVRVTLATPATTPGSVESRVTILCPSFEIGAAGDLWDEALNGPQRPGSSKSSNLGDERQPEAGKVWDRGRNWTAVVVEVIPGSLPLSQPHDFGREEGERNRQEGSNKARGRTIDEDVLEIPVFVRVEWEAEVTAEDAAASGAVKGTKESRELAFWTILGAGRIAG